jgi:hypothetical protein
MPTGLNVETDCSPARIYTQDPGPTTRSEQVMKGHDHGKEGEGDPWSSGHPSHQDKADARMHDG